MPNRKTARETIVIHADGSLSSNPGYNRSDVTGKPWQGLIRTSFPLSYEGRFTLRREDRGGKSFSEMYVVAYKKIGGKLYKKYMGKPESVTLETLQKVDAAFAEIERQTHTDNNE